MIAVPRLSMSDRRLRALAHCGGLLLAVFAAWRATESRAAEAPPRPNVLFIAVDDLRPELGCYGHPMVKSPNIVRLAAQGIMFTRAYCQWAICGVSRASLLTGMRPDTIRGTGMTVHFRTVVPDVVTLPQQFKNHGYHTQSIGKIFHGGFMSAYRGQAMNDPPSWSVPTWTPGPRYYFTPEGSKLAREVFSKMKEGRGQDPDDWPEYFVRALPTEAPDVADNVPYDGQLADRAIELLRELKDRPFFFGVGFIRPHLPFVAPKKYWDLYDRGRIPLPGNPQPPKDAPALAMTDWGELRVYSNIPKKGPLDEAQTRELIHGYYACVSYIDAQIGRVLGELDRLRLRERTIVVLWGDHGWHLGDHGLWCKHTNFENAVRVPLIVSAPGAAAKGSRSAALVEFVDLYPTLCELAGLPLPAHLEGTSFQPLLSQPDLPWKTAVFSQYPRTVDNRPNSVMGYSMRTDRYRFTRWQQRGDPEKVYAMELYDHADDPDENVNLAGQSQQAAVVKALTEQLRDGWRAALPADQKKQAATKAAESRP